MFQIAVIKENKAEDFTDTLWNEKQKILDLITYNECTDLNEGIAKVFNPDNTIEKYNLNTIDCLYTRSHTYQIIHGYEGNENYFGSVINYKRKPIKGIVIIVKIQLNVADKDSKIIYNESTLDQNDIELIIKDLFYHDGFFIKDKLEKIEYNNKYVITDHDLTDYKTYEINLFGIPIKIWFKKGSNSNSFIKSIGYIINENIESVYITCTIYNKCKCLSLDEIIVRQFLDLISLFPDEDELKEIVVAYTVANKDVRTDNVFIMFEDFYWKVKNNV